MKVALYARVSMDESREDRRYQEPENQLVPLRDWASRCQWEVVEEYVDRGSGADPNRPQFRRMLQDAMMLRFNAILVWRWDRFSREPMFVSVGRVQKLRDRGIGLKSLMETWLDTGKDNPMSDMALSIMAWSGAEERKRISDRTKAGIVRRRAIGQWKGGRPKKVIPEEMHAELLGLAASGKSITNLSRRFKYSKKSISSLIDKKGGPRKEVTN